MKMIQLLSLIAVLAGLVFPAAAPAGPPTLDEIIAEHCRARAECATVTANFKQTKVFTLFDEQETSSGKLFYARPDRICWQYEKPDNSSTVINGSAGWSVFPNIKQVQKFKLAGSQTNKVLSIVGFGQCGRPLTESFNIKMGEGGRKTYLLIMEPIDPAIRPYFTRIDLTLDRSDYMPRKIQLYEKAGDVLRFEFRDLKTDKKLDGAMFDLVVPDGYEVVEY
jgi:outer membrane lipoprotein-sorting protein